MIQLPSTKDYIFVGILLVVLGAFVGVVVWEVLTYVGNHLYFYWI